MNDYILITAPVAVVIILLLVLAVAAFSVQNLILQRKAESNRVLRDQNKKLREQLSVTQQELFKKYYRLPEVEDNG